MNTSKLIFVTILTLLIPAVLYAQKRDVKETVIHGHTMYTLLPPGAIPAIFEPELIPISQADSFYYTDEPLMVIIDDGEARAYSTWHLDSHEIVNDVLNGKAIAVTW